MYLHNFSSPPSVHNSPSGPFLFLKAFFFLSLSLCLPSRWPINLLIGLLLIGLVTQSSAQSTLYMYSVPVLSGSVESKIDLGPWTWPSTLRLKVRTPETSFVSHRLGLAFPRALCSVYSSVVLSCLLSFRSFIQKLGSKFPMDYPKFLHPFLLPPGLIPATFFRAI